jgi:glycosyltransferase involved in cell wall biosynthesis
MSPFASAKAAGRLAAELGCPWVADLRDPWALDEVAAYPTALHRRRELARMRRLLRSAAAIVMNTPEAARRLLASFPELRERPVHVIPNGFDAADFAGPPPVRDDGRFRIVHAGYLHTELGLAHKHTRRLRRLLGGYLMDADLLARSHVYLLRALERLVAADPALRSIVELHLAGVLSERDRAAAASPLVRERGYLAHAETVALMRSADLLFLPMHDLAPGERAGIVPGKTYEYLASGRPILAAVPDGDARDLLAQAQTAHLCRPTDVDAMAALLAAEIERWRAGLPPPALAPALLAPYERRRLTAELAALFDRVLEGRGAGRREGAAEATGPQGREHRAVPADAEAGPRRRVGARSCDGS